jgi:hypothetical protein
VAIVSSRNVWAVGYYEPAGGLTQTLIEHWDGTKWQVVPSPHAGGADGLSGVATFPAGVAWAVGAYNPDNGPYSGYPKTLTELYF